MSSEFRRRLWIPVAILILALYLIGYRVYQHRSFIMEPPATVLTVEQRMQIEVAEGETINVNKADVRELMRLPGVGEVLAGRVVETRKELGGFRTVEDLKKVKGIGENLFQELKNFVVLE